MKSVLTIVAILLLVTGCIRKVERDNADQSTAADTSATSRPTIFESERHFANLRQLTFGGQNAEAYFSFDASELILQSTIDSLECDAIFRMNANGGNKRMISSGIGVSTCAFIAPDGKSIIYSSTHLVHDQCPPRPDMSQGYIWPIYEAYDIFTADPEGNNLIRLTETPGYDAEAVYSPQGDRIIFTSVRTGDLELFLMDPDGSNLEQITDQPGYDGGAFFSLDGNSICWRASRPTGDKLEDYKRLIGQGFIRPSQLEIFVMNLKERKPIQLTDNGKANFGPYFHPSGKKVIFASNMNAPRGRRFDLYMVDVETKEIEQITHNETFDGFPMFSHDGTKLVFASNRNNTERGETNIFIADWLD